MENFRIRKLLVFYYLEDNTIMISEPKEMNSGTPQGVFLKRQMVLKQDGTGLPLAPTDFVVGLDCGIYGRTIRIYDCDQFTREFFENMGYLKQRDSKSPEDNFTKNLKHAPLKKDTEMKDFLEKSLGGGKVASQKQFLDNDRKVLRFFTKCDDMPYVIHYYLADDTVEIREVHHANDGRGSFAQLLKRQKLPKSFAANYLARTSLETTTSPAMKFSLEVSSMHSEGSSESKEWMISLRTIKGEVLEYFDLGGVEFPRPRDPKPMQIPPHNGFGDEVDSLGYVYKLLPDKPKRDFFKYVDNDKKVLRFTARFNTRVPEDLDRRFIIAFFLSDDTISIFEPA
eukprot:CAMPEP_0170553544 /NCGR_PEP_ID=MMETSP0211-20121228/11378_1 /TAXON_ID=311385 /ORGANISM="Pseudokeronopsis sp., Strain OXSARD2" /LENGTH=339 /DNA_ID=CAMNT_0010861953 /DNA_START=370 /DNA_END=1392 /DNA_ORIENTATION=+